MDMEISVYAMHDGTQIGGSATDLVDAMAVRDVAGPSSGQET